MISQHDSSKTVAKVFPKSTRGETELERIVQLLWNCDGRSFAWCDCKVPQQTGLPCKHVIILTDVLDRRFKEPNQRKITSRPFIAPYYATTQWRTMYSDSSILPPVLLDDLTPDCDIMPPPVKIAPGRKNIARGQRGIAPTDASQRRSECILFTAEKHAARAGTQKCSQCGGFGHNKRSCNEPSALNFWD